VCFDLDQRRRKKQSIAYYFYEAQNGEGDMMRAKEFMPEPTISQTFEKHLKHQRAICETLEEIADSLPGGVNRQTCLHAARCIPNIIKSAHHFEQEVLFPFLQAKSVDTEKLDVAINRLYAEHLEDEGYGDEICEALLTIGQGQSIDPEKLGYMLRGFFEGIRRHIAFEREVLAPLLT
jgi:hemerythrin-like domain-containing protein